MTAVAIELLAAGAIPVRPAGQKGLQIANDVEVATLDLNGVDYIELNFPKFSDGRAYSQAFMLRKRLGFTGDILATGDVLVDQVVQMQRMGFSSAVLREGQSLEAAQRQFTHFEQFYQGDAVTAAPLFARSLARA
jgi:uncharacterized protein (DUF934 family)